MAQVALQTGDPTGIRQARRAATRLRAAVDCASSNRLGAWLDARLDGADGEPNGAIAIDVDSLDPLVTGYLPASSPRMYTDSAILIRMLPQAEKGTRGRTVVGRIDRVAARYPDFPFLQASAIAADCLPASRRQAVAGRAQMPFPRRPVPKPRRPLGLIPVMLE